MKLHATTIEAEVEITPSELAALFWSCDSTEQIRFFNALAEYAPRRDFEIQMQDVIQPSSSMLRLTQDAICLLETLADMV